MSHRIWSNQRKAGFGANQYSDFNRSSVLFVDLTDFEIVYILGQLDPTTKLFLFTDGEIFINMKRTDI